MSEHGSARIESSQRLNRVLILLGLSVFINYIDRSNLSVAAPMLRDELGFSPSQLGVLLSAFFWTYSGCQLLSGWLVDHFDVKWVFAIGFFIWSASTAVTGLLHSFIALLAVRVILGIGESVAYPSYSKILGNLFPENRRGFANSIVAAGLALGPSFGMLLGGTLIGQFGWRSFFVALGLLGLLWLMPWFRWMPPMETASRHDSGAGMLEILRQPSAWGTCFCLFAGNYYLYFMVTWLPYYLVRERHFSTGGMAKVGGAVFLVSAVSATICGRLSDRWIVSGATPTRARKTFMVAGCIGIGAFLAASVVAPPTLSIVLLMMAGLAFGSTSSNFWPITQTLAGSRAVGRWCGIQLFVGNLAGVVAPALTGLLVDRTGRFFWPFLIVAGVSWAGALGWIFLVGRIEPIVWNRDTTAAVQASAAVGRAT
jgi:MFS transporter, ACS family, D-galactonate transporter